MSKKTLILFVVITVWAIGFSAFAQEQASPAPSSSVSVDGHGIGRYLLGPGDVLDVRVFGQPDLNSTVEIDSDGNVSSLPFLETPIKAQCRTDRQVQKDITLAFAKYIRNPQVSVRVTERKSRPPATISGAVRTPMQVTMMSRVRLNVLLTRAGGWTDRASGTVQIMHTQPEMCPEPGDVFQKAAVKSTTDEYGILTYKIADMKTGKTDADPYIRPGDIVMVSEGDPVYVFGAVRAARELVLKDKLTVGRAIAMAGGPDRLANTKEVHIYRQRNDKVGQDDLTINYDAIRKGQQEDVLLAPFDIIEVRKAGTFSATGLKDIFLSFAKSGVSYLPNMIIY